MKIRFIISICLVCLIPITLYSIPIEQLSLFKLCEKSEVILRGEIIKIEKSENLLNHVYLKVDKLFKGNIPSDSIMIFLYDPFFIEPDINLEPQEYAYVFLRKYPEISEEFYTIINPPSGLKKYIHSLEIYDRLILETLQILNLSDRNKDELKIKELFVKYILSKRLVWDGATELMPLSDPHQYFMKNEFIPTNEYYKLLTIEDKEKILNIFYNQFLSIDEFYQMFYLIAEWEPSKTVEYLLEKLDKIRYLRHHHKIHEFMLYIAQKTKKDKSFNIARDYYRSNFDFKILVKFLRLYDK